MSSGDVQITLKVFRLPVRVGDEVLRRMEELVARQGDLQGTVFDFASTMHIDFRALRRFVAGVRRIDPRPRPIYLIGLNPYCEAIVRFVLGATEGTLTIRSLETVAPEAPGGRESTGGESIQPRNCRVVNGGEFAEFFPPSPN